MLEVNIRELVERPDTIELTGAMELNEADKEHIALPYLRDLYKDLARQSENEVKGISRVVFQEVSI